MPNHSENRRPIASWLLVVGAGAMLSGCVAAVVPIAAGGMLGKKAVFGHKSRKAPPATPADNSSGTPTAVAARASAPTPTPPPRGESPRLVEEHSPPPAVTLVPPPPAATPAPASATSWDSVARTMARLAARTPDHLKLDVLQPSAGGAPALCGAKHAAVAIDTGTLGSGDALYVGALYTMGFEIVLMSRSASLPASEVKALAKQGIAAPVPGRTLFVAAPGREDAARAAIARQYCVVGLVGDHAADFPGHVLPGAPDAREGWFYVPTAVIGAKPG